MKSTSLWGLGARIAFRRTRSTVLLSALVMVVVALTFTVASVRETSAFDADEVARISMGESDILVRSGADSLSPGLVERAGRFGMVRTQKDLDITTSLQAARGAVSISGRILKYRDPMTDGMLVRLSSLAGTAPGIALSPSAAQDLGVGLGDRVHVLSTGGGTPVQVTDLVTYAADTKLPIFVLDPSAVTTSQLDQITSSSQIEGTPRWLVRADDIPAALEYLTSVGAVPMTAAGAEPVGPDPLLDMGGRIPALAAAGLLILAGGAATIGRIDRDHKDVLLRLGLTYRELRRLAAVRGLSSAVPGVLVALPVAVGLTFGASELLAGAAAQDWGEVVLVWPAYTGAAALTVLLVPISTIVGQGVLAESKVGSGLTGGSRLAPAAGRKSRILARIPARLAAIQGPGVRLSVVSAAVITAIAIASSLIITTVQARASDGLESMMPAGRTAVGVPRHLSDRESALLGAATNSTVFRDVRAVFTTDAQGNSVPAMVNSKFINCARARGDLQSCMAESSSGALQRSVAITDVSGVEGLFGRPLNPIERRAFELGDGLMLADPQIEPEIVAPAGYVGEKSGYGYRIDPVAVTEYERYERMPGLLMSADSARRYGLDADHSPISYYVLTGLAGTPLEAQVRAALPIELATTADVIVPSSGREMRNFSLAKDLVVGLSTSVTSLLVLFLIASWANLYESELSRLIRLGAHWGEVRKILAVRSLRSLGIPVALGVVAGIVAAYAFLEYAGASLVIADPAWATPIVGVAVTVGIGPAVVLRRRQMLSRR